MAEFLRAPGVTPGAFAADLTPTDEQLYVTQEQAEALYGITCGPEDLRYAQTLVNAYCHRISLWPTTYEERLSVPDDRLTVQLSVTPVVEILAASGRYTFGRRHRSRRSYYAQSDYLAALALLGNPPAAQLIDPAQITVYPATGECWLPTGLFLVPFSEVQIQYIAGYTQIPHRAKDAVVDILNTIKAKGVASREQYTVGRIAQRFTPHEGFISENAKLLLEPFVVQSFF